GAHRNCTCGLFITLTIERRLGSDEQQCASAPSLYEVQQTGKAPPPVLFDGRRVRPHPFYPSREGMERRGGASGACATRTLWHPLRSGCLASCGTRAPNDVGRCASPALHREGETTPLETPPPASQASSEYNPTMKMSSRASVSA